jgi:hypothetical protein
MTVVSSDQRPTGDDPVEDLSTPVSGGDRTTEDRPKREVPAFLRRVTWRFFLYAPVLLVLVVLGPMLAWKGFSILRNEDTGEIIGGIEDPNAPGFQALVTPTPTTLLADIAPDGSLAGVTLITLPSQEGGGNIVFFPVGTLLDVPFRTPPEATLAAIHAEAGLPGLEQRLETMLGAGIGEVVAVPARQWANLVAPVAPLTVQNPVAVETTDAGGQPLSFPQGEIPLTAAQVGPYLQADTEDQADTVRLSRHEAFWTAWLAALDEAGEDAVPGEGEAGIGGAVRGLTGGPRNLEILPATPVPIPGVPIVESDLFRPDVLAILATVPEVIPFPQGVGRPRTRLVMGVEGQTDRLGEVSHTLVQAGAEISVIANAEAFGEEETVVYFFRANQREKAQRLLNALGTGTLVRDTGLSDTVDVVVVLGQDYIDSLGGGTTATTLPASGTVPTVSAPSGSVAPGATGGETSG